MNYRPVGADLRHAERRTDRRTERCDAADICYYKSFLIASKNKKKIVPVKDMQLLKTVEVELHPFITLAVYEMKEII